jgi:hypothetical protein
MSKMSLHDPFGHLKHKLWPKERLGVKLAIWFSTAKSQESPWFPCVQVVCDILLENFPWGIKFGFKPHLNLRFAHKVMGPQNCRSPNFGNFGTPTWESWDKMTFGCWSVARHRVYYKGEGGGFLQIWAVVSLVSLCLPVARSCTKLLHLCIDQFVVWFCIGPCE